MLVTMERVCEIICARLLLKRVNFCDLLMRFQPFCPFFPPSSGTLTQNEMVFRRLHLGTVAYGMDSMDEVQSHVFSAYTQVTHPGRPEWEAPRNTAVIQWLSETERKKVGKNQQTIPVVRNISGCDDCLGQRFLTSDDILCPPPPGTRGQRSRKQD